MIMPSTRASIRPRALSTSALPHTQARSLFGWSDPVYPRSIRHRTIKVRAKLLKTLRRRQQYDWDVEAKPFLSTKHVRYASHWDGTNRQRWGKNSENDDKQVKRDTTSEGHELSEREKAWKKQMEAMRKRVEADPYEAVFGKRFEPFWTPLVPRWMKEEMGLSKNESEKSTELIDIGAPRKKNTTTEQPIKGSRKPTKINTEQQAGRSAEPYSYASSTSWDSQTNKTKKSEWDSVSRKTSNYEYDPVSNRMVPLEAHRATNASQGQVDVPSHFTWNPIVAKAEPVPESSRVKETPTSSRKAIEPLTKAGSSPASSQPKIGELEALSANDIRASMGKARRTSAEQEDRIAEHQALKQQIRDWDNSVTRLKGQVSTIVDEVSAVELGRYLPTSLDRHAQTLKSAQTVKPMQPALQRMQTKSEPEPTDLDDSAAHESTELVSKPVFMPRDWSKQADILQSERVIRTTGSHPQPTTRPTMRWLDDMNARKAEYQTKTAAAEAEKTAYDAEKNAALEKANAMLQAEVASHKLAMNEHQDRSSNKIRSLRGELETAYKQSSVHADAFRDRIADLESELSAAQNTKNEVQVKSIKEKYSHKVRGLQKELERAYTQSSVHADEFTKRIKTLENELVSLTQTAGGASDTKRISKESKMKEMQGEGDFCPDVVKFAISDMWYKQPSSPPQPRVEEMAKIEQTARDKKLVAEVKSIYESAYGVIDTQHQQPQGPERVALDETLAKYDERSNYAFKSDGLEAELSGKSTPAASDALSKHDKHSKYTFKSDGLEAELSGKSTPAANGALANHDKHSRYDFKRDGLEAELSDMSTAPPPAKHDKHFKYAFQKDGLEADLSGKSTPATNDTLANHDKHSRYAFKRVELSRKSTPPAHGASTMGTFTYGYKSDNLETELTKETLNDTRNLSEQDYRYKDDGLESDLRDRDQDSKNAVNQRPERFVPDDLEAELKKQGSPAALSRRSERFKPDGLEAELKRLASIKPEYSSDEYEAEVAKASSTSDRVGRMEQTMATSLGSELHLTPRSVTAAVAAARGIQWQQPPLYKVVAYDSGNDRFSTATTTSWDHSVEEQPITIPQALSQLYQPARWTQHFANLQREGYQVVHAREDVLVLKKVKDAGKAAETTQVSSKPVAYESQTPINPVDGTSHSGKEVRPVTGDYANPTGYVNLDLAQELASKPVSQAADRSAAAASVNESDRNVEHQNSPRIKRQEALFSGTHRVNSKKSRRARREANNEYQHFDEVKEPKPRSLLLWTLGVGAVTSAAMYVSGSVAEKAKEARLEREARTLEPQQKSGSKGRWRLDEGVWKREG